MALFTVGTLLERERELDALQRLVASAADGLGSAALIQAEAGIGKTALLAAGKRLSANAGMTVLAARAGELESEFAWGVARQLFDRAVGLAPDRDRVRLLGGAAALARPALGLAAESGSGDVYATLHGLYWLTVNLAQQRPLLLSIDDLHWADRPSLRFIAHLLARLSELPILVLAAARPAGAEPAPGTELLARIAVEPDLRVLRPRALSSVATTRLVRERLADDVGDDVCEACFGLSGGNPFLLRALLAGLSDDELPSAGVTVEHVRRITPAAVSASVLLQLARLPSSATPLARAVAVLGAGVPFQIARELAGLSEEEATAAAVDLIRSQILIDDDGLTFVHPLVRAAVYGDLPPPERSRWHLRSARLLAERDGGTNRIASHLVQSSPSGDAWTVEQLRRGAADASARGAPEVAADFLRRALAEPPSRELRGEVLYELGQVELVHDPAGAVPHLYESLANVEDPQRRAEIALALGGALTLQGALTEAIDVLGTSWTDLSCVDASSELSASLEAARLGAARWEPSAQTLRNELVDGIRRRSAAGAELDHRLHSHLAIEAAAAGTDRDNAVAHARAALSGAERPAGAATSALPEAMLVLAFADLAEEAKTAVDAWLEVARANAWPFAVVLGATIATLTSLYRGAVSDAVANAQDALTTSAEIRLGPVTAAFLVEALIEHDELEQAGAALARGGLDGELPYAWATTPLLLARGRLHAARGEHATALEDLMESGRRAERWAVRNPAMHGWRSSAAVSLAQVGDRDSAVALAEEEVELARRWGAPRAIGVALRAAGLAHGDEHGVVLLREAADVLQSSTAPLEYARALTDLGSTVRRLGRRAQAREHLRQGLDLAHQLGGMRLAARARAELTIAGARPRRDALRGRNALTPSELRVAELAANGRTNREIAEQLFVTLRTVEAHLTSSYGKLGIASRQQLAATLGNSAT